MLKLSGVCKSLGFEFTDVDGVIHNLKVTQYSVKDHMKLIELQKPVGEMADDESKLFERSEIIQTSRVVVSVKTESGGYFWDSVEAFREKNYPNDLLDSLCEAVLEINPYPISIAEKKSKS